ncbi:hypothetical protein L596_025504 [Steinernema carpocapsae]|uniref:Uncharacterized protein n=1 Tax=Steinernema carpocapsae TaxID=34508 RepID=A0A4U5M7Y8_STECR|nr:hypothetical protein L596_025504 [Steinernema carpocapsae]
MERVPDNFAEDVAHLCGIDSLKELQKLDNKYGKFAKLHKNYRFNLAVEIYLSDPKNFSLDNLGSYRVKIEPKKQLPAGECPLAHVIANHKYLSKLIVDIGVHYGKHANVTPFGTFFLSELKKLHTRCRFVQLIIANDRPKMTEIDLANFELLMDNVGLHFDQTNVEMKLEIADKNAQLPLIERFFQKSFVSMVLDEDWDYVGYNDNVVDLFFNINVLSAAKDTNLPGILSKWFKSEDRNSGKFYLAWTGGHFYDSEAFFEGFELEPITWKKGCLKDHKKLKVSPRIVKHMGEACTFSGDVVVRLLCKKHPKLENYYICLLLEASVSQLSAAMEEDSDDGTRKTPKKVKTLSLKLKNHEFAQNAQSVALFSCAMQKLT